MIFHDDDRDAGRTEVFLGAAIDDIKRFDINFSAQDVA